MSADLAMDSTTCMSIHLATSGPTDDRDIDWTRNEPFDAIRNEAFRVTYRAARDAPHFAVRNAAGWMTLTDEARSDAIRIAALP